MPVPLSLQKFSRLAEFASSADARNAGLMTCDTLIPSGCYVRRRPLYLDFTHAEPQAQERAEEQRNTALQKYGTVSRGTFRNATVTGQGALVTENNILLEESCIEYLANSKQPIGIEVSEKGHGLVNTDISVFVEQRSLLLKRPSWANYGHWLVEGAAAISLLAGYISRNDLTLVIGKFESMTSGLGGIIKETIDLICPNVKLLFHPDQESWRFSSLDYVTPLHNPPSTKVPLALEKLRTLVLQEAGKSSYNRKRIYLSRADQKTRRLSNEDEVVETLNKYGFERVFCNGLSLLEQARLFNQCEVIIGVKGAAMSNILFAQPHCKVMALSPGNWPDPFFFDICTQLDLPYGEIFCQISEGPVVGHHDLVVDPSALRKMLEHVI